MRTVVIAVATNRAILRNMKVFGSEAKKHPHICGKRNKKANMNKILVFVLLAVAAAPVFAATTTTTNCTGTITSQAIAGNMDVPAGATCRLEGVEVVGNVTVEGILNSFSSKFDKNVTVTGAGQISLSNGETWMPILGNLTIAGSSGNSGIYCPNHGNVVQGNISVIGNSGSFYICSGTVNGGVTINDNTGSVDLSWLTVGKNVSCSGNDPAPHSWSAQNGYGSTINAQQKTGQCAGL
jgi:hypothetical protein